MSSLSANSGNIKSVMRTALVGIKPADQVMLKGYLRVLLRLEADLEWVSANHPEVDLFMINNDFRQAANIIKLLQKNANTPVLYIGRSLQESDGRLNNDLLTLPLKDMQMLNEWLFEKVEVLHGQDNAMSERRNTADKVVEQTTSVYSESSQHTAQSNTHTELNRIEASNLSLPNDRTANTSTQKQAQSLSTAPTAQASAAPDSSSLLSIIQNMRNGVSGRYQLSAKDDVFAIIEPSKALIWTKKSTRQTVQSASLVDWKVEPTSTSPSSVAHDLKQWLWDTSKDKLGTIYPFIDAKRSYRLGYWVKPMAQDNRSELLRVMTAMESEAKTLQQISEVSGVSTSDVQQVLAGLFFAGYLYSDNYEDITISQDAIVPNQTSPSYSQFQLGADSTDVSVAKPAEQTNQQAKQEQSPLDAILSQRAAGEAISQTSSRIPSTSVNSTGSNEPKNLDAKPEKKGFLSRLRKKLGL